MNEFELAFQHQINVLNIKRKDVAEAMGVTMPTLKSKLRNPERITLGDLHTFKDLNFNLNQLLEL